MNELRKDRRIPHHRVYNQKLIFTSSVISENLGNFNFFSYFLCDRPGLLDLQGKMNRKKWVEYCGFL